MYLLDFLGRYKVLASLNFLLDLLFQCISTLALEQELGNGSAFLFLCFVLSDPTADHVRPAINGLVSIAGVPRGDCWPQPSVRYPATDDQAHLSICSSFSFLASSLKWAF